MLQCGSRRFCSQSLAPPLASQPPSNFWIRRVAPEPDSTETDHFPFRLHQYLPSTELPLRIQFHLTIHEPLDLLIGPWPPTRDISHHFHVGRNGTQFGPVGTLPRIQDEPLSVQNHRRARLRIANPLWGRLTTCAARLITARRMPSCPTRK